MIPPLTHIRSSIRPAIPPAVGRLISDLRGYSLVLGALLRQEEEVRRRSLFEAALMVLEPVIFISTILLLRKMFERSGAGSIESGSPLGGNLILFYATGFYLKYLFIYVSRKRIKGAGGTPRTRFPVEQRLDGLIVHVLLRLLEWLAIGVLVFGGLYLYGIKEAIPNDFGICVRALLAAAALGFGWGIFGLVMNRFFQYWHFLSIGLNRAFIILSGCLFVPDFLPLTSRYWIDFNPEMHAIAYFRSAFYPHYPTILLDTTYLTYCCIGAIFIGLVLERVTRRYER